MRLPTSVCFPLEVRERGRERSRTRRLPARPSYPYSAHASADASRQQGEARWREARTTNNGLAATPLAPLLSGKFFSRCGSECVSPSESVLEFSLAALSLLSSPSPPESVSQEPYLHSEGSPSLPPHASKRGKKNSFLRPLPPLCVGVCLLKSGEEWRRRRRRLLQLQCAEEAGKEAGSLE